MSGAVERGRPGRTLVGRLRPNLDMVEGIEAACAEHGLRHAQVRSAVGSLVDATLAFGGGQRTVAGPGVEILTLVGEVRPGADGAPVADLRGTVGAPDASIHGGRFLRGANAICITLELVLEEWLPEDDDE